MKVIVICNIREPSPRSILQLRSCDDNLKLARLGGLAIDSSSDSPGLHSVFRALLASPAISSGGALEAADVSQHHGSVLVPDDRVCALMEQVVHRISSCTDYAGLVFEFPFQAGAGAAADPLGAGSSPGYRAADRSADALEGCP